MVNTNVIKTIEDAKNVKYNNKELTNDEKTIFENSLLKKWDERIDLDEVHNTALLLDTVKKAEKAELSDGLLTVNDFLNTMKKAKGNDTVAYRVVNSYNNQVDEAINRLESLSKDKNVQGAAVKGNFKAGEFLLEGAEIYAAKDTDNIQGIQGGDDVEIKGSFKMSGAKISVKNKQIARTEEEIQDEIIDKEEELESKRKRLNVYEGEKNAEAMERVENEIKQLKKEIRELKSELRQAQIQVSK